MNLIESDRFFEPLSSRAKKVARFSFSKPFAVFRK
jgi:hypothetical protein